MACAVALQIYREPGPLWLGGLGSKLPKILIIPCIYHFCMSYMTKSVDKAFNTKNFLYSIEHCLPKPSNTARVATPVKDSSKTPPASPSAAALQLLLLSRMLEPEICQLTPLEQQQPGAQEQPFPSEHPQKPPLQKKLG